MEVRVWRGWERLLSLRTSSFLLHAASCSMKKLLRKGQGCLFFFFAWTVAGEQWDVFTNFRAKSSAGRKDWRAFQLVFILYGGRRRGKFGGPSWKENRAIMLCYRSWVVNGCQKLIRASLSWSPQERVFFWRNIYGSTLEARQVCRGQSKQCLSVSFRRSPADASLQKVIAGRYSAYKHPHIKWKGAFVRREHFVGGRWQGCRPTIGDDVTHGQRGMKRGAAEKMPRPAAPRLV